MSQREHDVLDELGALPELSPPPDVAERIRLRARRELRPAPRGALAIGRRVWWRLEPAFLAAFAAAYLGWAIGKVAEVHAPPPAAPTAVADAAAAQGSAASARDW